MSGRRGSRISRSNLTQGLETEGTTTYCILPWAAHFLKLQTAQVMTARLAAIPIAPWHWRSLQVVVGPAVAHYCYFDYRSIRGFISVAVSMFLMFSTLWTTTAYMMTILLVTALI